MRKLNQQGSTVIMLVMIVSIILGLLIFQSGNRDDYSNQLIFTEQRMVELQMVKRMVRNILTDPELCTVNLRQLAPGSQATPLQVTQLILEIGTTTETINTGETFPGTNIVFSGLVLSNQVSVPADSFFGTSSLRVNYTAKGQNETRILLSQLASDNINYSAEFCDTFPYYTSVSSPSMTREDAITEFNYECDQRTQNPAIPFSGVIKDTLTNAPSDRWSGLCRSSCGPDRRIYRCL